MERVAKKLLQFNLQRDGPIMALFDLLGGSFCDALHRKTMSLGSLHTGSAAGDKRTCLICFIQREHSFEGVLWEGF